MNDDLNDAVQQDLQQYRRLRENGGFDTSIPALVELGFASIAAVIALVWFAAMFLWVPNPLSGSVWMGFGLFGLGVFGGAAGLIHLLRNGGAATIRALVRESIR